ncbi:MAG: hypothetical protein H6695_20025 [Deferribacteres bacterium]|nr:hypothetical protein [Deferribacteres bacterium]
MVEFLGGFCLESDRRFVPLPRLSSSPSEQAQAKPVLKARHDDAGLKHAEHYRDDTIEMGKKWGCDRGIESSFRLHRGWGNSGFRFKYPWLKAILPTIFMIRILYSKASSLSKEM